MAGLKEKHLDRIVQSKDRFRWWLFVWLVGMLLALFVGVAWFLLFVAVRRAVVLAAMTDRARARPTPANIALMAGGTAIVAAFVTFAVIAFLSGDPSLLGALTG